MSGKFDRLNFIYDLHAVVIMLFAAEVLFIGWIGASLIAIPTLFATIVLSLMVLRARIVTENFILNDPYFWWVFIGIILLVAVACINYRYFPLP